MSGKSEVDPALIVVGLGLLAFILYQVSKGAGAVTSAVAGNPLIQGASSVSAAVIEALTFGSPIEAQGTLVDSNGNVLGSIASFPAANGSDGNTYLNVNGSIYELTGSEQNGDYVGTLVGSASSSNAPGSTTPPVSAYTGGTGYTGGSGLTGI